MTLKTYLTRSFYVTETDGELFVQNAHKTKALTDISIRLEYPDDITGEVSEFTHESLEPGERVFITRLSAVGDKDSGTITAHCKGRVDGGDVDTEPLRVRVDL